MPGAVGIGVATIGAGFALAGVLLTAANIHATAAEDAVIGMSLITLGATWWLCREDES
jgi:hypothetical protein